MMKLIECPRDAMQGLPQIIPTEQKVEYIQSLLGVGFDTIDFGSFVNPKAVPQMADTAEVYQQLDLSKTKSKLLAIVANQRGAEDALQYEGIDYLGFPFSVSPTFQFRNTNASQEEAINRISDIQNLCLAKNKQLVVYLSMAFGNPYGDAWSPELVQPWVEQFASIEIPILALSDTIGVAEPGVITQLFETLIPEYKQIEFGAHFHSLPNKWEDKISSALDSGCRRFDSTIHGIGGCPMADDDLVGNIATENLLLYLAEHGVPMDMINQNELLNSIKIANRLFG